MTFENWRKEKNSRREEKASPKRTAVKVSKGGRLLPNWEEILKANGYHLDVWENWKSKNGKIRFKVKKRIVRYEVLGDRSGQWFRLASLKLPKEEVREDDKSKRHCLG